MSNHKYTLKVEAHFPASPELLAKIKAGQDEMQSTVDKMLATFNGAVDRAALLLLEAGLAGVVAWSDTDRCSVTLKVDDVAACTVAGEYVRDDGRLLFNVTTTWHAPYEHLGGK